MTNPLECRKSQRVNVRHYLTHLKPDSGGEKLSGFTKDLSSGGLSFNSSVEYKADDTVHLEINLPGWKEVTGKDDVLIVPIKVVRVQQIDKEVFHVGACFIWDDQEKQKTLEKYMNKQTKVSKGFFS